MDYNMGLNDLLAVWGKDLAACEKLNNSNLNTWPDTGQSDLEFVYIHSSRFDKIFKMNCSFAWSANEAIEYIIKTLNLPLSKELPEIAIKWEFSYGLIHKNALIPPDHTLALARVNMGSILKIQINGAYKDLSKESIENLSPTLYSRGFLTNSMKNSKEDKMLLARGTLTKDRIKEIANLCFSHLTASTIPSKLCSSNSQFGDNEIKRDIDMGDLDAATFLRIQMEGGFPRKGKNMEEPDVPSFLRKKMQ
jgi:hypothetical protein